MGDGEAPVTRRSELQKVVNLKSVATKSWVFQKSAGAASSDLRFAFIFFEMCLRIALTDHREFGEWFRVKLEGPFVPGPGLARADDLSRLRASQMGAVALAAWPPSGKLMHLSLPRWATRCGYRSLASSATGSHIRSLS
jgi:hypothetical protein